MEGPTDFQDKEIEQNITKNAVEITGVPEESNENVFEIIKKVGDGLGMDVTTDMVENVHRSGKKTVGADKPRSIIVKFSKRKHKEDFLKKRRLKRILAKDINLPGESRIYINESLSEECQKILNAAIAVKKEKGFKYLWVRNGKVLLRKEENGNVVTLSTLDQVAAL